LTMIIGAVLHTALIIAECLCDIPSVRHMLVLSQN